MAMGESNSLEWQHDEFGTSNDSRINVSLYSQLNKEVLCNMKECFPDLQIHAKLNLLTSFLYLPRRFAEECKLELEDIIKVAGLDSDPWVSILARGMKIFPASSFLHPDVSDNECNQFIYKDLGNNLKKKVPKHTDSGKLPLEFQYLSKSVHLPIMRQEPRSPVTRFAIKRKTKCSASRKEVLQKSVAPALEKGSAPTIREKNWEMPRRMADTIPPSTSDIRSTIICTYGQKSSVSRIPEKHKHGLNKLSELPEKPLGEAAAKKRKRHELGKNAKKENRKQGTKTLCKEIEQAERSTSLQHQQNHLYDTKNNNTNHRSKISKQDILKRIFARVVHSGSSS